MVWATPRIYVASLSDYNAGRLHGIWIPIDEATDTDQVWAKINAMLAGSRELCAEEWAIHDYEGFRPLHLSEWADIGWVTRVGRGIAEHGPVFAVYADLVCDHYNDPEQRLDELDRFEDRYRGEWDSQTEWATEWVDDVYDLDRLLEGKEFDGLRAHLHFDYEAFGEELASDYEVRNNPGPGGGVVVFDMND